MTTWGRSVGSAPRFYPYAPMSWSIVFAGIGTDLGNAAQETARAFGLDGPHFIAQVISFSIVAFMLHRFAYKPVLQAWKNAGNASAKASPMPTRLRPSWPKRRPLARKFCKRPTPKPTS